MTYADETRALRVIGLKMEKLEIQKYSKFVGRKYVQYSRMTRNRGTLFSIIRM